MISIPTQLETQSKDRNHIINICCFVETVISDLLKNALGLMQSEKSISFGNSSQALSFNAKLNLFLDYETIEKKDRENFIKLQEIRNQFAHNFFIKSFTDLNSNDNGKLSIKFLEKN